MNYDHLNIDESSIGWFWDFLKRWRQIAVTVSVSGGILIGIGAFVKSFAGAAVTITASRVAKEEVKRQLHPVKTDIERIQENVRETNDRLDTINKKQEQTLDKMDFVLEILIENNQMNYQKVKRRREMRGK